MSERNKNKKRIFEKHDFENFYGAVFGHLSLSGLLLLLLWLSLSTLVCLFVCWIVQQTTEEKKKQLTFLSQVFINCVTNFKIFLHLFAQLFGWRRKAWRWPKRKGEKLIRKAKNQINNWFVLQLTFLCVFCKYFIIPVPACLPHCCLLQSTKSD